MKENETNPVSDYPSNTEKYWLQELTNLDDVITHVLTTFNNRQSALLRHELTSGEMTGLKAMFRHVLGNWLEFQLKPVEQHFSDDGADSVKDLMERFLMYLVLEHGVNDPLEQSIWYNVTTEQLNKVVDVDGKLSINDDQSVTLSIKQ